jgi:hypothetical protein
MEKERIYLVGQISMINESTYLWRRDIREFFQSDEQMINNFDIIDPCLNEWITKSNEELNKNKSEDDFKRDKIYKIEGMNLIVPKDYNYVLRSSGCIVNLNHYDTFKPVVGSLFELAWYYERQEKFVVGVFDGDWTNDVLCNHPFVRATIDTWCYNHMEAAELIKNYYMGTN